MSELNSTQKIDVPSEHWDRLFAPSACLVMITTVDGEGRINAASFGTCVRVCHDPVFISFTVGATKDTYHNVLATEEFVVNVPPFEREILEKVMVVGKVVAASVDEGCTDENGYIVWQKLKPAHYCGNAYKNGFVAAYEKLDVDLIYKEPVGS